MAVSATAKQLTSTAKLEGRIFGVDEAGRGAMAGPLAVAAVETPFPPAFQNYVNRVKDSKRLSPKARADIGQAIMDSCKWACVMIPAHRIDQYGIQAAETEGMLESISTLTRWDGGHFEEHWPDLIVCDGTPDTWGMGARSVGNRMDARLHYMIKGDKHVPAISAASIVAKYMRDLYMAESHLLFPQYRFDLHVGYVTPLHLATLEEYGSCDLHRHTFRPVRERDANV